jgi:hypothetical protein
MEQPCYKCGQTVEQGVPFCPHCSSPQIRVVIAEPAPPPLAFAAASSQDSVVLPASQTVPVLALPMQWSQALKPCALAGLVASAAMVLKLVAPLIAVVGAGFFAVAFYRRNCPGVMVRTGSGARLGALCGLLCSGMTAVLGAVRVVVLNETGEIRRTMLDSLQQAAARYSDPQVQPTLEFLRSPTGLVFMMVFLLIFVMLTFLLLGTLGGALAAATLGRHDKSYVFARRFQRACSGPRLPRMMHRLHILR